MRGRSSKSAALRRRQSPAGMQQDIRSQLHRIVPAEILEIDECQRPIAAAQTVVEAKIGRNEAAPFRREFAVKIKAGRRQRPRRCQALARIAARKNAQGNQEVLRPADLRFAAWTNALRLGARFPGRTGKLPPQAAALRRMELSRRAWTAPRNSTAASMSASLDVDNVIAVNPAQQRVTALDHPRR